MIAEMYIDIRANVAEVLNNLFKLGGKLIRPPQKLIGKHETTIQMILNFPSSVTKQNIITAIKPNVKGKKLILDFNNEQINIPGSKKFRIGKSENYPISINEILSTNKN